MSVLIDIALLAADSPGPRDDNPGMLGGVVIIVGIVVAAIVLGFVAHFLLHRFGRTRPDVARRRPQRPGSVGRIWEFRERR